MNNKQTVAGATLVICERIEMDDGFIAALPDVIHIDIYHDEIAEFLEMLEALPQVIQMVPNEPRGPYNMEPKGDTS